MNWSVIAWAVLLVLAAIVWVYVGDFIISTLGATNDG